MNKDTRLILQNQKTTLNVLNHLLLSVAYESSADFQKELFEAVHKIKEHLNPTKQAKPYEKHLEASL